MKENINIESQKMPVNAHRLENANGAIQPIDCETKRNQGQKQPDRLPDTAPDEMGNTTPALPDKMIFSLSAMREKRLEKQRAKQGYINRNLPPENPFLPVKKATIENETNEKNDNENNEIDTSRLINPFFIGRNKRQSIDTTPQTGIN